MAVSNLLKYFDLAGEFAIESLPETDLAYIAGLFDGEGCIYIATQHYGPQRGPSQAHKKQCGDSYRVRCAVGMTNEFVIHWLHEVTGLGRVYYRKSPSTDKSKPAWYWKTNDKESIVFLSVIKPYLKIKQSQAGLGLELLRIKTSSRRSYKHMPERQLEIVEEFSRLNQRGVLIN